jgi:hypothetical protein
MPEEIKDIVGNVSHHLEWAEQLADMYQILVQKGLPNDVIERLLDTYAMATLGDRS